MFNKLRSAVTSALPGNPLSKDFDVLNHIASGGPGLVWKIYNAIKKTTKQVRKRAIQDWKLICDVLLTKIPIQKKITVIWGCEIVSS